MEITMQNLTDGNGIDRRPTSSTGWTCSATLGRNVLISNYGEYYRLAAYLSRYTTR